MDRVGREVPLPQVMQGRWTDIEEPSSELTIAGGEVIWRGRAVEYDHKEIAESDGAWHVDLMIDDEAEEDSFQRDYVTGLMLTPEGELFAYNVKFSVQLARSAA